MNDYSNLKENLRVIDALAPLSERELAIARLQFNFDSTRDMLENVEYDRRFYGREAVRGASILLAVPTS